MILCEVKKSKNMSENVVVKPKKEGKVSLYVETISNKKIYKASMKINVSDIKRSLNLSSKSGMIVLSKTNTKIITYSLNFFLLFFNERFFLFLHKKRSDHNHFPFSSERGT